MALDAAVVVSGPAGRAFVRASVAREIVSQPTLSRVPNSALSMALVGGRVVSVIELSSQRGALLVCELGGEAVAFAGLGIERVGFFEIASGKANIDGAWVPELPLIELVNRAIGFSRSEPA